MSGPNVSLARRDLLRALALLPVGLAAPAWAEIAARQAGLVTPSVCLLTPETTAGPFYLDEALVRRDIREGRPGLPLALHLQVVSADCEPIAGARVDVWHCDAAGNYSGFAGQGSDRIANTRGETFLRGSQITDAGGQVRFQTIYPGWYRGRTVHIHHRVFLDARTVLTSQIFFPEAATDAVFATPAYAARRRAQDTNNDRDAIARRAGPAAVAEVSQRGDGLTAALVVGIAA